MRTVIDNFIWILKLVLLLTLNAVEGKPLERHHVLSEVGAADDLIVETFH